MKVLGHTTTGGVLVELEHDQVSAFVALETAVLAYADSVGGKKPVPQVVAAEHSSEKEKEPHANPPSRNGSKQEKPAKVAKAKDVCKRCGAPRASTPWPMAHKVKVGRLCKECHNTKQREGYSQTAKTVSHKGAKAAKTFGQKLVGKIVENVTGPGIPSKLLALIRNLKLAQHDLTTEQAITNARELWQGDWPKVSDADLAAAVDGGKA